MCAYRDVPVYRHVCKYTHMHVDTDAWLHAYIHVCRCTCVGVHVYVYMSRPVYLHVYPRVQACM